MNWPRRCGLIPNCRCIWNSRPKVKPDPTSKDRSLRQLLHLKYGATVGAAEGCDLLIFRPDSVPHRVIAQARHQTGSHGVLPAQSAAFSKIKDRSLRQLLHLKCGATVGAAEGCDLLIFRARWHPTKDNRPSAPPDRLAWCPACTECGVFENKRSQPSAAPTFEMRCTCRSCRRLRSFGLQSQMASHKG
jgi:hypothetical protein